MEGKERRTIRLALGEQQNTDDYKSPFHPQSQNSRHRTFSVLFTSFSSLSLFHVSRVNNNPLDIIESFLEDWEK